MNIKDLIKSAKLRDLSWFEKNLVPKIISNKKKYLEVEKLTGIPAGFIACIHTRENAQDVGLFKAYLGNGQVLNKITTIVPKGRGPFKDWVDGAVDALVLQKIDKIQNWNLETAIIEWEKYNGLGYKNRGKLSPYVWTGTQHGLGTGYFTSDGKYSSSAIDNNIGCFALYQLLIKRDSDFVIKEKTIQKRNWFDDLFDAIISLFTKKIEKTESEIYKKISENNPRINKRALEVSLRWLDQVKSKKYMLLVDFNLHSLVERAFLINLETCKVELSEQTTVGRNTDPDHDGFANSFGNVSGSGKSSLGAMMTGKEYGKTAQGWSKFDFALKLHGLQIGLNDKVYERAIVIHDSSYAETGGRSLGCLTFNKKSAEIIIDKLGEGSLVYCYHESLEGN